MSGFRKAALSALAAASLGSSLWLAPAAMATEDATWDGKYLVTLSAHKKTGTSMAANQPEPPQLMSYTFSSSCSSGVCIAKVIDSPPPKISTSRGQSNTPGMGLNGYGKSPGNGTV
jgi:hypothetical protein